MTMSDWQSPALPPRAESEWPAEARLLAAYFLSGPCSKRIGCFPFDPDQAAGDIGLSVAVITASLETLVADGFARFDQTWSWIWMPEVLIQRPFTDSEEVRRTLPELAAVPRAATFYAELIQLYRGSADRPGTPQPPRQSWLTDLVGNTSATELAERLSKLNDRLRRHLPGLPSFSAGNVKAISELAIQLLDYVRRCRSFLTELVNTPPLHLLGLIAMSGAILFVVFPGIDLGVAGWFFDPPHDFTLGASWIGRFFDTWIHFAMEWFLVLFVGVFVYGRIRRRVVLGLTPRRFLFVALSIALGAGLLTNVILKDSWGRARPSQVAEFGGPKQFTPPFMRSTQCDKNCSFVSGDASLAASFLAFAVIADRNRRRWWIGLSSFTAIVGLMRMARGSHFLSDVVFAVIFTLMVVFALERLILQDRWRDWPKWRRD